MWVFGYGSLMWDGWQDSHGCTRRALADLLGYQRAFNKASVKNWGTKANPCPTLNLVAVDRGECRGVAFEFPNDRAEQIRTYLTQREGRGFVLRTLTVRLEDGSCTDALVPMYQGHNIISTTEPADLAPMIACARGTDGSCFEYVCGIVRELAKEDINDPVVAGLATHISRQ